MPTNATRRPRPAEPRLSLSIQHDGAADGCPASRPQLRRWVRAALERDAVLTLRLVGEAEARTLNAQFRGRDYATNVLTFAYGDDDDGHGGRDGGPGSARDAPVQADIVICLPVLAREAREQRRTLRDHLAHLVVHGVLHAQGLDHEDDDEARAMEARETEVLRRFRIADPYR